MKYCDTLSSYLASPNNPTGNCLSKPDLLQICAEDCVVVLDEAYAEFAQVSLYETARALDNVIFCRTFSKWAALAGMRVGYCIAHPTFVTTMMAVKQPYNIPVCSESAALAALSARGEIMKQVLAIVDERGAMVQQVSPWSCGRRFRNMHHGNAFVYANSNAVEEVFIP